MSCLWVEELSLKLGLPERTVSIWAEKQLLCPSIEDAMGRGSKRIWSENDLSTHAACSQGAVVGRLVDIFRQVNERNPDGEGQAQEAVTTDIIRGEYHAG